MAYRRYGSSGDVQTVADDGWGTVGGIIRNVDGAYKHRKPAKFTHGEPGRFPADGPHPNQRPHAEIIRSVGDGTRGGEAERAEIRYHTG